MGLYQSMSGFGWCGTALSHNPLLALQGRVSEAEPLYERSQAIQEKVLGPEHPGLATMLNSSAGLLSNYSPAVNLR